MVHEHEHEDNAMPTEAGSRVHWASLESRVTGLETGIRDIASSVRDLAGKIDTKSQTPWGVIASFGLLAVAVLGGFGKLAYDPIKDKQDRLELVAERILDKAELGDRRVNERVTATEKTFREQIVPRAEVEMTLNHVRKDIDALASRIEKVESRPRP